jgi:flavodoxin
MESVVIYASRKGNTRHIAETIAASLARHGTVRTWCVDETPEVVPAGTDLLVIGGPTETHGMTPRLAGYLDQLELAEPGRLSAAACGWRASSPAPPPSRSRSPSGHAVSSSSCRRKASS